jgi:hypothetical protein
MGVIVPEGYAQTSLFFSQAGGTKQYVTTMGIGPLIDPDPFELADSIFLLLSSTDRILNPSEYLDEYSFDGVRVSVETGTGPLVGDYVVGPTNTGTLTGSPLPVNVSMISRKRTLAGGRRGRGRSFFPPMFIGETLVDGNGTIDPDRLEALNIALAGTLDAWNATTFAPCLLHSDGGTPDAIQTWVMEPVVATQRRRLRR